MATVYIKNTRECDITLNVGDASVTVPRGFNAPGNGGFAPGIAKVDDAFLAEGIKHPVIKSYFENGWLIKDGKAPVQEGGGDETPEYLVGNVSQVQANIKALPTEQLAAAAEAEKAGQNRKGVLDAIEYEIKQRTAQ